MFVDVVATGAPEASVLSVPRSAVQNAGDRTVVYLANPKEPGEFIEREVRPGQPSGQQLEAISGVQPGDVVVTEGRFFVRAEGERLGLRPAPTTAMGAHADPSKQEPDITTLRIDHRSQQGDPSFDGCPKCEKFASRSSGISMLCSAFWVPISGLTGKPVQIRRGPATVSEGVASNTTRRVPGKVKQPAA